MEVEAHREKETERSVDYCHGLRLCSTTRLTVWSPCLYLSFSRFHSLARTSLQRQRESRDRNPFIRIYTNFVYVSIVCLSRSRFFPELFQTRTLSTLSHSPASTLRLIDFLRPARGFVFRLSTYIPRACYCYYYYFFFLFLFFACILCRDWTRNLSECSFFPLHLRYQSVSRFLSFIFVFSSNALQNFSMLRRIPLIYLTQGLRVNEEEVFFQFETFNKNLIFIFNLVVS